MRTYCAAGLAMTLSLWLGCIAPGNTTLRIGITESAGATMLYLAEEFDLYRQHGVNAKVVELADYEALEHAFKEELVDAVVLSHKGAVGMINDRRSDAGVLLVLAIAKTADSSARWQTEEEELLLVRRAEVMRRRSEWSKLLSAYEDVRLRLNAHPDSIAAMVALREHRNPSEVAREIALWNFFGLAEQDSLLDVRGTLSDLDARWQGNLEFAAGYGRGRMNRAIDAKKPEQQHSR